MPGPETIPNPDLKTRKSRITVEGGAVVIEAYEQTVVTDWLPDITCKDPDFTPAVEYVFATFEVAPESASAPDHTYIYEPVPPDTVDCQLIDWPISALAGTALQETVKLGDDALKVAVTFLAKFIVRIQDPVPLQAPDQPAKVDPLPGAAESVKDEFSE